MKRLGIVASATLVRAAMVMRGRAVWVAERPIADPSELHQGLAELVAEAPAGAGRARVGLEADLCRVKILSDLPPVPARRLRQLVAVHSSRWFLRNGHPLVTDAVRQRRTRLVVAAAADDETVEGIARGVAEAGLVLDAIVPMGVVGLEGREGGTHEHRSGSVIECLVVANGELTAVRRAGPLTSAVDEVSPVRLFDRKPLLDLRPPRLATERARRRLRAARICFAAASILWLAAGATWSVRVGAETRALRARLDAVRPDVEVAMRLQDEIGRAEGALTVLDAARRDRSRVVDLLAGLTRGLPDSAYVTSLRTASDGTVSLAGLAPSAGHAVRSLAGVPGILDPELQGPVTRERIDGLARERFAARLRWNPPEGQE